MSVLTPYQEVQHNRNVSGWVSITTEQEVKVEGPAFCQYLSTRISQNRNRGSEKTPRMFSPTQPSHHPDKAQLPQVRCSAREPCSARLTCVPQQRPQSAVLHVSLRERVTL